jgi:ParB family chromosome partitioning protein
VSANNPTNNRLGRGLDSLIPTDINEFAAPSMPKELAKEGSRVEDLPVGDISPNPHQPRSTFNDDQLGEMAQSIKEHGILQPLVVVRDGKNYQLIAGERRLRAAKLLGLATVPAIIRSFSQQEQLEVAVIENIQRSELNLLELASAYATLNDQFSLTLDQIAQRVGKAPSTVGNIMRLLNLPHEAKQALNDGLIVEGHARQILAVKPEDRPLFLEMVLKGNLTVRQAEELARDFKAEGKEAVKKVAEKQTYNTQLTTDLGKYLGTKVDIQKTAKGGKLVIEFYSEEELGRLYHQILGEDQG